MYKTSNANNNISCSITLLKIFNGAPNDFSIDESAMASHVEVHLLSLDIDMEFPINWPISTEDPGYGHQQFLSSIYPVHVNGLFFFKTGIMVKV